MSVVNYEVVAERWRRDAERLAKIVAKHEPNHVHLFNHRDLVARYEKEKMFFSAVHAKNKGAN